MRAVLVDFHFFAYSIQLANALSELCQVTLMLPSKASEYEPVIRESVDVHWFDMPRLRYPTNLWKVFSLFRTIARLRPQVVHLLAWNPWMNMCLPLFPNIPLVATIHDAKLHPGDKESYSLFHSWQWRWADQIVVHAEAIKNQMIEEHRLPEQRIQVLPHGAYDLYTAMQTAPVSTRDNVVLFFGRIWEYKGLRYLIEAEPLITDCVPDARIVIAGEGEPFEKYERMMVNRSHFVVHNYRIPDDMIPRLFQEASVVALPYTEASQSGVLAMAYAFAKPVVATNVGGIPEAVEHGQSGYLVPPRDPRSLADAIISLLRDRELRMEMGRRALEKAETELSWPSIAQRTVAVYRRAMDVHQGMGRSRISRRRKVEDA